MEPKRSRSAAAPLWTRDFTILTLGSVVSLLGNAMSGFAMSLLVLDLTGSTLLFALYNMLSMLPHSLAPLLAGPLLDRYSRRKTIYTLDFITAGLFLAMALILSAGKPRFAVLAGANLALGAIGGVYTVAYDSFYPLLISEGNFQKAYSVSAALENLAFVMVPVATLVYKAFGIVPLFAANAFTYLIAAVLETRIRAEERYTTRQDRAEKGLRAYAADFREGMLYLWGEKGLLAVAAYFFFSFLNSGMCEVVTLPYFRGAFENGEYVYMLTWGASVAARFMGGGFHYFARLPAERKFGIAFAVYLIISVLEGAYLFFRPAVMAVMVFFVGLLGVTSYNIRISTTQSYVPDEKKGRFNGAFNTMSMVGILLGQALGGGLSTVTDERTIVVIANVLTLAAALVFIGGGKRHVEKIYNQNV